MEPTVDEIRQFLQNIIESNGAVLGSALGSALKTRFPGLNIRNEYGGVGQFIEDHCAESLRRVGKQGGDDVFGLANSPDLTESDFTARPLSGASISTSNPESPNALGLVDAWRAFSNPSDPNRLLVSADGKILVNRLGEEIPEGFIPIEKLSREEYRKVAIEFSDSLEEMYRRPFVEASRSTNFWPRWSALVNSHKDDGLFFRWMSEREDFIRRELFGRMQQAGVLPELIDGIIEQIASSRRRIVPIPTPTFNSTLATHSASHKAFRGENIHALVHSIVDRMSESELRRVWLPLGAIVDATNE